MSISIGDERRWLSADEAEVAARSHMPALREMSDGELTETLRLLREWRDRARDTARQQRREMRGKSAPRGARPAADNTGTTLKKEVLSGAVRRLNKERQRRREEADRESMQERLQRALERRQAMQAKRRARIPAGGRSAREGMSSTPSDERSVKPDPRETGRVSQFVKSAQARRDSR